MKAKECRNCGKIKKAEEFWPNKATDDGLHPYCDDCATELASRNGPREKFCPMCEQMLPASMFYRNAGPSSNDGLNWYCKRCQREQTAAARKAKPAQYSEYVRRKYRERQAAEGSGITEGQKAAMFDEVGRMCPCCKRPEGAVELTIDHVIPISRGGRDSPDNMQVLCRGCNAFKGTREYDYRKAS